MEFIQERLGRFSPLAPDIRGVATHLSINRIQGRDSFESLCGNR